MTANAQPPVNRSYEKWLKTNGGPRTVHSEMEYVRWFTQTTAADSECRAWIHQALPSLERTLFHVRTLGDIDLDQQRWRTVKRHIENALDSARQAIETTPAQRPVSWQDRLKALDRELSLGIIDSAVHRRRADALLADGAVPELGDADPRDSDV